LLFRLSEQPEQSTSGGYVGQRRRLRISKQAKNRNGNQPQGRLERRPRLAARRGLRGGLAGLLACAALLSLIGSAAGVGSRHPAEKHEAGSGSAASGQLTAIPDFAAGAKTPAARAFAASTGHTPSPPFRECPAIGADQSCGILIYVTNSGAQVLSDPSQEPYDGGDDTLVGIVNASSKPLRSIALSSGTDIFGFDGDGICTYTGWSGDQKCPYGPTGYEGPGVRYGVTSGDSGPVFFTHQLSANGGSAYFGLEEALSQAAVVNTQDYAALGDSYSAGVGTLDDSYSAACNRGPKAWPMLLGSDGALSITKNSFFACSGAKSWQELHGDPPKQPDQVQELHNYASSNGTPGLVTITAGGNDAEFAELLKGCYTNLGRACASALHRAINYLTNAHKTLPGSLSELYEGAAKAAGAGTRIEAVGYPAIFPAHGSFDVYNQCRWLVKDTGGVLSLIGELTKDLNGDIQQAVSLANTGLKQNHIQAQVAYADTEPAFSGHELCTGKSWVAELGIHNALNKTAGHPLPEGQKALAESVLQTLESSHVPFARRKTIAAHGQGLRSARPVRTASETGSSLAIETIEAPAGTVGAPYVVYLNATGGTEPLVWSVTKGTLPAGLTLDSETGVIAGVPTSPASTKITVSVKDSESPSVSVSKALTITTSAPQTLTMGTEPLPAATVGQQYQAELQFAGGTAPVTWTLEASSLPEGLSLDPETGLISGTPTTTGERQITVVATDSAEPAETAHGTLTLNVVAETAALAVSTSKLPAGTAGEFFDTRLNSTGGTAPITWSISTGALPEGITLDPSTGELSGIPSAPGTYSFTVSATDRSSPTPHVASTELHLTVGAATPVSIITTAIPAATQGTHYLANLDAEGGVSGFSWQITSGNLPPGLTLSPASGTIEGTPAEAGTFTFTATAYDSSTPSPQSHASSFTIKVAASSPAVTFSPPEATINVPYSYTPEASGGVEPYAWSISGGELPAGLSIDESTGTISGTPTATGSNPVTVRVADSSQPTPQSAMANTTMTVAAAAALGIESESLPGGVEGQPYRAVVFASGGTEPYAFSITHGSLPTGVSLDPNAGVIEGTPEAQGNFEVTVQVTDASQPTQTRSATLKLTVGAPPPLSVETSELAEATAGESFSQALIASGGSEPYIWSVTSGNLPHGLELSESTGEITGTPTEAGTFNFTAKATDSSPTPQAASVTLTLTVNPTSPLNLTTSSLTAGTQGSYYDQAIEAQGGVTPYTFSLSSGSPPEGLSLDPYSGTIYGTPTSFGTSSFTVQVMDSSSPSPQVATRKITLKIAPAPALTISASSLPAGTQGQYYDQSLGVSGGVAPYPASVTSGSLPEGLSIDQSGDIYGEITSAQSETFTIAVHDGSTPHTQTVSRQYTIEVSPAPPLELAGSAGPFVLGQYGSEQLGVSGGVPGYTWMVSASKLPAGLTFSNGYLYGTPTKKGKGSLTVTVTDSATPAASTVKRTVTFSVVNAPKLKIATKKLPAAAHGVYYQQQVVASGGSPPLNWSLSSGSLPPGMAQSGEWIYGTPETAGSYKFTITVTDSGSKPQTASKKYTLKVS
jgi:Putative Ig domain/GDSL-like Lipase/Acylhydrolase family